MKQKKPNIFKSLFKALLIIILIALVYVFLLLGEPESSVPTSNVENSQALSISCKELKASSSVTIQDLVNEFGADIPSKPHNIPTQDAGIECNKYKNGYKYTLNITYPFNANNTYTIKAYRPISAISINSKGYELLNAQLRFAGLIGVCMQGKNDMRVIANTEKSIVEIIFPKTDIDSILNELSTLILTQVNY